MSARHLHRLCREPNIPHFPAGGRCCARRPEGSSWEMIACSPGRRSYLWHESLTIFTSVIVRCPCSESAFFMPLSAAALFASSFKL